MMDAIETWMTQLAELCFAFYDTYQSGLSERAAALDAIQAHARTTPEGFALVPDKPVGEIESFAQGSYGRKYAVSITANLAAGTKLYAAPPPKSEPL